MNLLYRLLTYLRHEKSALPPEWDMLELHRSTPFGTFTVTLYPEGKVFANRWPIDGSDAHPVGPEFSSVPEAVDTCDKAIKALNRTRPRRTKAVDTDAF